MLAGLAIAGEHGDLVIKTVDAGLTRTRGGLVGGDHELREDPAGMEGTERVHHRQRRAVGVADDALGSVADLGGIDLGHDQRHVGVHPEGTGVIDHDRPARHRDRGPVRRDLVRHVEHRHVDAVEGLGGQLLDHDVLAADLQDLAR